MTNKKSILIILLGCLLLSFSAFIRAGHHFLGNFINSQGSYGCWLRGKRIGRANKESEKYEIKPYGGDGLAWVKLSNVESLKTCQDLAKTADPATHYFLTKSDDKIAVGTYFNRENPQEKPTGCSNYDATDLGAYRVSENQTSTNPIKCE